MSQLDNSSNSSIYTPDEIATLEKMKNIRLKTIDKMTEDGKVPEKVGEIRVLNEMITAAETNIQKSAENRLKFQDNANKESLVDSVSEMLKAMARTNTKHINTNKVIELAETYIPVDVVEGELEIQPDQLIVSEFIPEA